MSGFHNEAITRHYAPVNKFLHLFAIKVVATAHRRLRIFFWIPEKAHYRNIYTFTWMMLACVTVSTSRATKKYTREIGGRERISERNKEIKRERKAREEIERERKREKRRREKEKEIREEKRGREGRGGWKSEDERLGEKKREKE